MDDGKRLFANYKFAELLPQRAELGNTKFRKTVIAMVASEFDISIGAASTHYNHAFQKVKAASPELVLGLGRADDKKGGRKAAPKVVMADPYFFPVGAVETVVEAALAVEEPVVEEPVVERLYTVKRAKDGVVIFRDMTKADADALVAKAKTGKKATLVAE